MFCKEEYILKKRWSLEIHGLAKLEEIMSQHKLEIPHLKESRVTTNFWLI